MSTMREFKFFQNKESIDHIDVGNIRFNVGNDGPTPYNPSYYNVPPDLICVGITPRRTNPITYETYRYLVYEDIRSGRMTQANIINTEHPMWSYSRVIEPDFYNSRYVDGNETVYR